MPLSKRRMTHEDSEGQQLRTRHIQTYFRHPFQCVESLGRLDLRLWSQVLSMRYFVALSCAPPCYQSGLIWSVLTKWSAELPYAEIYLLGVAYNESPHQQARSSSQQSISTHRGRDKLKCDGVKRGISTASRLPKANMREQPGIISRNHCMSDAPSQSSGSARGSRVWPCDVASPSATSGQLPTCPASSCIYVLIHAM